MRDSYNDSLAAHTILAAAAAATVTGIGIDLSGFESALVIFSVGTITDGTHTPKLQDSPDNTNWTDVGNPVGSATVGQQLGSLTALVTQSGQRVGYVSGQRYLRVFVTVAGATTGGVYGAVVLKGHPRHMSTKITQAP